MDNNYEQLAEAAARAQQELAQFGTVSARTAADLARAQSAVSNFDRKMSLATGVVSNTIGAFVSYNKAVYQGASAAESLNQGIDKMADAVQMAASALALLMPGGILIRGLVAGLGLLAGNLMKAGKEINTHTDKVFKGFQEAARAGAVGAGGMKEVFDSLMKVGLGTDKFAAYLKVVNENADTLTLFGSSVLDGRRKFDEAMEQLGPFRVQLEQMGLDREKQAEATMSLIRVMRMSTTASRENMEVSGRAVARYIEETDKLTRVTGLNREKQEEIYNRAMRREQFASTIYQLDADKNSKAAEFMRKALILTGQAGGDVQEQFMDAASTFGLTTEMAAKGFRATGGELQNFTEAIRSGKIQSESDFYIAYQRLIQSYGTYYKELGSAQAQLGIMSDFGGSIEGVTGMMKQSGIGIDGFNKIISKAEKERQAQLDDPTTKKMAEAANNTARTQIAQMKGLNLGLDVAAEAIAAAAEGNRELAESALEAAKALDKISGRKGSDRSRQGGGAATETKGGTAGPGAAPATSYGGGTTGLGAIPGGKAAASQLEGIKNLIGRVESFGGNYNVIAGQGKKDFNLTEMPIRDVMRLKETVGGSGAAGKYQVIPTTLQDAIRALGIRDTEKFSEENQEKIGEWLIRTRGGYDAYLKNPNPTQENKDRLLMGLANVWRGLPNKPGTVAGAKTDNYSNKAGIGWDEAIQMFAEGGRLGAGKMGIAGEAGAELVTGPADITPMNDLMSAFRDMIGVMQQSLGTLERIDRNTSSAASASDRMLRLAQN